MSVGITRVVLLFRRNSDTHFCLILHTKWLLKIKLIFLFFLDTQDCVKEVLVLLHKLLGELQFPLLKNILSQLQKQSEQIFLKLLLHRLEKLSVDEKTQNIFQKMLEQKKFETRWEEEKRNPSVEQEEPLLKKVVQNSLARAFLTRINECKSK